MDCCELARLALWIIGGAFGVILFLFIMCFGYSLKLDARTVKLEKKNGHEMRSITELLNKSEHEQHQLEEVKKELTELKSKLHELPPVPEKKSSG